MSNYFGQWDLTFGLFLQCYIDIHCKKCFLPLPPQLAAKPSFLLMPLILVFPLIPLMVTTFVMTSLAYTLVPFTSFLESHMSKMYVGPQFIFTKRHGQPWHQVLGQPANLHGQPQWAGTPAKWLQGGLQLTNQGPGPTQRTAAWMSAYLYMHIFRYLYTPRCGHPFQSSCSHRIV